MSFPDAVAACKTRPVPYSSIPANVRLLGPQRVRHVVLTSLFEQSTDSILQRYSDQVYILAKLPRRDQKGIATRL
jgi:hypothetical protein